DLAAAAGRLAHEAGGGVLADDEVEIGIAGHAVAFVRGPPHLPRAAFLVPAPPDIPRHVGEQEVVLSRMPDRPLGEDESCGHAADWLPPVDQVLEFRCLGLIGHRPLHPWHAGRPVCGGAVPGMATLLQYRACINSATLA